MNDMRDLLDGSGMQVMFVDETSKNNHDTAQRHGLAVVREWAEFTDVFVRGDRYSLAAALSKDGYFAARVVPGSFDSLDFYDFICKDVVNLFLLKPGNMLSKSQKLPMMNAFPDQCSVLMLDNCRIHHNEVLVELVTGGWQLWKEYYLDVLTICLGVVLIYLPPYSLDINPIEESYSMYDLLCAMRCLLELCSQELFAMIWKCYSWSWGSCSYLDWCM
jgi:hypothetical protein